MSGGKDTSIRNSMERVLHLECRRYVADAGMAEDLSRPGFAAICAYIMCCTMALPVRTVIVGERPYATDIHPPISSAMSYDPSKSRATPSTLGVANDVSRATGCTYVEVESWFRDSWMYLHSGVVVVNCAVASPYSSSGSAREVVAFQRWLRSLVECSARVSQSSIDIVCMGVPAQNTVDATLRSMDAYKRFAKKKVYPNPAMWSRTGGGDARSREYTFDKKGTSTCILKAVRRSEEFQPLTLLHYVDHMNKQGVSQLAEVTRVIDTSKSLVDEIEEAYAELDANHKKPSLKEAHEAFSRALISYRDTVLYDLVRASVSSSHQERKIGKPTEWGSKATWHKPTPSTGGSTKMSTVQEDTDGVEVKFDDGEDTSAAGAPAPPPLEQSQTTKAKKKVIVRRVRKPKTAHQPESTGPAKPGRKTTPQGARLSAAEMAVLRTVRYYLSEEMGEDSASDLIESVAASVDSGKAETRDIGTIVDTAALDQEHGGIDASTSLGMEDGTVREECMLPKLLKALVSPHA